MNTDQINSALEGYELFQGTHPANHIPCAVPNRDQAFIINTDPCIKEGQHWVALTILKDGSAEYFDSFGRRILNTYIQQYVDEHCTKPPCKQSAVWLQHPLSKSCGLFCIDFIKHRSKGFDLESYLSTFKVGDFYGTEIRMIDLQCRLKRAGRLK